MPKSPGLLHRFIRIMPWWCWLLYVCMVPLVIVIMLALVGYHWQMAIDWQTKSSTIWITIGVLAVALLTAFVIAAARERGEKSASGKGKRVVLLTIGLLMVGTMGVGIAVNIVRWQVDRFLVQAEAHVGEFYHNADTTRVAAWVVRMIILKERETTKEIDVRYTLKAIADHVPDGWMKLAAAPEGGGGRVADWERGLVEDIYEEEMSVLIINREPRAVYENNWTPLLRRWPKETYTKPLPEETRLRLESHLQSAFTESLSAGLKLAYERGDNQWSAMYVNMAIHLMEEASRDVPDRPEWKWELAALHTHAAKIQHVVTNLYSNPSAHSNHTIDHFQSTQNQIAWAKASLALTVDAFDFLFERAAPVSTPSGVMPSEIDPSLAAAIRDWIDTGNPLERAAAEVADGARKSTPNRWDVADEAIARCKEWKLSVANWTPSAEFRFLIVQGDRLIYNDDPVYSVKVYEEALALRPTDWLANVRLATALTHQRSGDKRQALARAKSIFEGLLGPQTEPLPRDALIFKNLALVLRDQGDLPAATASLERALAIDEKHLAPDDTTLSISYYNLAAVKHNQGDLAAARSYLERAMALEIKFLDPNHRAFGLRYALLAKIQREEGDLPGAQTSLEKAIAINGKNFVPNNLRFAHNYYALAEIQRDQDDLPGARASIEKAIAIYEKQSAPDHPALAECYATLATILVLQEDLPHAIASVDRAIAIHKEHLPRIHPLLAKYFNNRSAMQISQGDFAEARTSLEQAAAIMEKLYAPDDPKVASLYHNMAYIFIEEGDVLKACTLLEKALAIYIKEHGEDYPPIEVIRQSMEDIRCSQ